MSDVQHTKFFDMSDAVRHAKDIWLMEAGIAIEGQATLLAPVKTGRLRGSITWATRKDSGGLNQGKDAKGASAGDAVSKPNDDDIVHIGTNVEYAMAMEYGSAKYPTGQPYLRPALRVMRPKLKARWGAALKKGIANAK
jgi:hypothetical protein